jgi:two-component system, cell cycle sensor histidine kinase and response regulator CckA
MTIGTPAAGFAAPPRRTSEARPWTPWLALLRRFFRREAEPPPAAPAALLDRAAIGFAVFDGGGRTLATNSTWTDRLAIGAGAPLIDASRRDEGLSPTAPRDGPADATALDPSVSLTTAGGDIVDIWAAALPHRYSGERRFAAVARTRATPDPAATPALRSPDRAGEPTGRFFADAPVGIAIVDRSGRLHRANRVLGRLLGAAPAALCGQELTQWLDPDDRDGVLARLATAGRGDDPAPLEIRLAPPHARTMVMLLGGLSVAVAAAPGAAGPEPPPPAAQPGADELTLYFIDVTERKQLEAQVAQSAKMQAVGQLAGGVAHDFNNLLTAMIGFCDLLLMRSRPGDPAFADLMQIKQNANRAANLVRQLLAFSRQQSHKPRVLDITDVLVELSHLLRRLIGENIALDVIHGRELGLVEVDQGQLEQVVINLAVNARDAMPGGGRLTIRTEGAHLPQPLRRGDETMPAGDYVLIEISDTGHGIAPEHLGRIFEPFFSTKPVGSGTGLGLSTVYGIVKQTGGFVFVDSVQGGGTRFSIYLPRHASLGGAAARPGDAEPLIPRDLTGNAKLMLVEDDDAVRMFGARALRNKGYRVVEATSGETALDLIRHSAEPIDLLISDVVMPQMDGPTLVREVRALDPEIKVIFMSGYAEEGFRQRLDREPDIDFLAKPFTLKELAAKVKEVVGRAPDRRRPTP